MALQAAKFYIENFYKCINIVIVIFKFNLRMLNLNLKNYEKIVKIYNLLYLMNLTLRKQNLSILRLLWKRNRHVLQESSMPLHIMC